MALCRKGRSYVLHSLDLVSLGNTNLIPQHSHDSLHVMAATTDPLL